MMKVSDYIVRFLENHSVHHVFMLVGGQSMHLNDSIGNSKSIRYISCLHEQAAAMAAESYARCRNDVGVVVVTNGPAATNTLTAVACAWVESTSLMVISGQVKRGDSMRGTNVRQMGVQEVDIVAMAQPVTKYAVYLDNPLNVRFELEKCMFFALHGRKGPVLMDIPLDVQASMVDETTLKAYHPDYELPTPNIEQVINVCSLIAGAQRPVLYIGAGVFFSGGQEQMVAFAERHQIPILTTWNGMDLIWEDHPLYMGRPGAVGQRHANFILQNADVLITVGTRLSCLQTGFNYDAFARNAKLVMVDIDQDELDKKKLHPYMKIRSDAKSFFNMMLSADSQQQDHTEWLNICRSWRNKYPVIQPEWKIQNEKVNSYCLVDTLSRLMNKDDVYCGGRAGTCVDTVIQAFHVKRGQRVIATKGLSSMGYGLPAALGAAIALPDQQIICCNGDGGFVMNIQELATIKNLNLPIKFFILNNRGYATIVATQSNVFNKHLVGCEETSGLSTGDIISISEAYGLKTFRISNNSEIESVVKQVLDFQGPVVCDVDVSITQPIQPRQSSYKSEDGQMKSRPLEDMRPLLDREELESIMSISKS
ncbi:MAG: thiamine pyrophosphate-binding protein [Bacteroidaceae bacterium]|nr:thiamine pyrophosphate-binding protein [Bacteroidaceae bacterium]